MQVAGGHAVGMHPLRQPKKCSRASRAIAAIQQKDCRDMVNERKQITAEGSVVVTFLGNAGSAVAVECPKVQLHDLAC